MLLRIGQFFLGLIFIFPFSESFASSQETSDFKVSTVHKRSSLSIGAEFSQLSGTSSSLQGFGLKIKYMYSLDKSWAAGVTLSENFNASGGSSSVLYTAVSGQISYALMGRLNTEEQTIFFEDRPIAITQQGGTSVWTVGASVDQLFLNGSSRIYPASGLSLMTVYQTYFWGLKFQPELSFGQLQSGQNESLSIVRASLLILFEI